MIPHLAISRRRLAFILGGLAMFGPFSIDTVFPAFQLMARDLGVGKVAMQQTISVYLLGYAAMSLFHGPISDAIGRKKVLLAGIAIFTLASVGAALATDMTTMLAYRALQGLSAGVGLIVGRAVVRDALDGDDAQRLMSQISMIFGIAPAIAPVIGGWILGFTDWHGIFWFLAGFGVLLGVLTAWGLPESHPPEARTPLRAGTMLRDYWAMVSNRRFRLLALAGTANFGALFLYISSAPDFVMGLLGLGEQDFVWFFAPTIGGMMLGAFVSGRAAGRITGKRLVEWGFACCGVAAVYNLGYNALVESPSLPWAVLPTALGAFGIALVFPIVTLAILDMYPRQRGGASSMQAFVGLLSNAAIAGLLSPLVSHSGLLLAAVSTCFTLVAYGLWRWYVTHNHPAPL
ncbi:MAG: Bcr/CflA family drug resistance efflux transporter [Arenimonas sp. SCN 70-307]|uniref:multidrug effflux MFS transporter n=1 Tax=Arenimonas sp. SCN 70-307 TaxID=1660089 RepID=UPI00086F5346|nr:multidrug effflux MFS transporter [Arenimonas sp. SCN 70-307]ODS61671.1 MAG: Bcr/CflA family drug resistance efflux transporter [Arenimonas sp. SCN 70-307]